MIAATFTAAIEAARAASRTWPAVPASVTLAQWALESGWGQHMPPGSNNPFGIKARPGEPCVSTLTWEFVRGHYVKLVQSFRKFATIADAFAAHAKLLATAPAYAQARAAKDAEGFARALTGVYATDPHYGDTLIALMREHHMAQLDRVEATPDPPPSD